MLVNLIVLFPFFVAGLIFLIPQKILKLTSVILAAKLLFVTVFAYFIFKENPKNDLLFCEYPWISSLKTNWSLGIDSMSLIMIFLSALVSTLIFSTIRKESNFDKTFYSLVWMMIGAMMVVFTARDGFVFYVFWEIALLPIYFICLKWGEGERSKITFKFFAYTLFGSLLMLAALLYVYQFSLNGWNIDAMYAAGKSLSLVEQNFIFWGVFLAFAIKLPIFPFHTWQPDTYYIAPTQGTMLLSGIMLKMGTYGIARWLLPLVPMGVLENSHYAIILSVIGVVYASCIALVQKDFKRMMAWASIAHVGLIGAGLFVGNTSGIDGAFIQMLSHGVNVVAGFFVVDIVYHRTKTYNMDELGGIRGVAPIFGLFYLVVLLATVGLPFTNGFVGEFLLLSGIFNYNVYIGAVGAISVVLGAAYMLKSYQKIMLGEVNSKTQMFEELKLWEKSTFAVIALLILVFGLFPNVIIELIEGSIPTLVLNGNVFKINLI